MELMLITSDGVDGQNTTERLVSPRLETAVVGGRISAEYHLLARITCDNVTCWLGINSVTVSL